PLFMSVAAGILILGGTHITLSVLGSSGGRLDPPRQAVAEVTPPAATAQAPAKVATAPAPPVPDSQLLAPTRVATTQAVAAGEPHPKGGGRGRGSACARRASPTGFDAVSSSFPMGDGGLESARRRGDRLGAGP